MVGIDSLGNKDKLSTSDRQGSIYLYACPNYGYYVNGNRNINFSYSPKNGDRMQIKVDLVNWTIEWRLTYPVESSIGSVSIPENMRVQELFPSL